VLGGSLNDAQVSSARNFRVELELLEHAVNDADRGAVRQQATKVRLPGPAQRLPASQGYRLDRAFASAGHARCAAHNQKWRLNKPDRRAGPEFGLKFYGPQTQIEPSGLLSFWGRSVMMAAICIGCIVCAGYGLSDEYAYIIGVGGDVWSPPRRLLARRASEHDRLKNQTTFKGALL
jgi:hypothetical protein